MEGDWEKKAIIAGFVVSIGLFIGACVTAVNLIGTCDKDHGLATMNKIGPLIGICLAGVLIFTVTSAFYFHVDPTSSQYFTIITSSLALGLAYTAVVIAAMTK